MRINPLKIIVVSVLYCFLMGSLQLQDNNAIAAEKFKPFKLRMQDGTKKTLPEFTNKVTLVAFYYPTCAYCNLALPEILKINEKYKDQGLTFVIINVKPEESKLIPGWKEKYHFEVPVLAGASQDSLMDDYKLERTPTHFLLGAKGEVLLRQNGYDRGNEIDIEKKIAEILSGLNQAISQKP